MRDVTWVITCMDPEKFRLMLCWLPDEPWLRLLRVEVVTHRERPDIALKCASVAEELRPRWPIDCRTDQVEESYLDSFFAPEALRVYFNDLLGVKLMLPLTIGAPMLFTDDDVVVLSDPSYVLGTVPWASQSGLDAYTETAKDLAALGALSNAFAPFTREITLDTFNMRRTDAGVWYLPNVDRAVYTRFLRNYFEHDHTVSVSQDTGVAAGNHTQRFRKLDQRFLSGYMIYRDGKVAKGPVYRALADKNPPKTIPSVTFAHYCSSGRKPVYMEWLGRECAG